MTAATALDVVCLVKVEGPNRQMQMNIRLLFLFPLFFTIIQYHNNKSKNNKRKTQAVEEVEETQSRSTAGNKVGPIVFSNEVPDSALFWSQFIAMLPVCSWLSWTLCRVVLWSLKKQGHEFLLTLVVR